MPRSTKKKPPGRSLSQAERNYKQHAFTLSDEAGAKLPILAEARRVHLGEGGAPNKSAVVDELILKADPAAVYPAPPAPPQPTEGGGR